MRDERGADERPQSHVSVGLFLFRACGAGRGSDGDENLRRLIRELPERQRLALFLRYFADLDYEAIGAILGIASETVAASLHSAHATIRKAVEEAER